MLSTYLNHNTSIWKKRPIWVWHISTLHKRCPLYNVFVFFCIHALSKICFSLTRRHNVAYYTHKRNTKAHFIEDSFCTVRIMRNSQCFIIKAFVESSISTVYGQPDMYLTIHTHGEWYHCMEKVITGNIFYNFPREKQYRKSHYQSSSVKRYTLRETYVQEDGAIS